MDKEEILFYLREWNTRHEFMSLATILENKPLVCNLHYHADDVWNLYFISTHSKKHCIAIEHNKNVSCCMYDHASGQMVVDGIQISWICTQIDPRQNQAIVDGYFAKFPVKNNGVDEWYRVERWFYKVTPNWIRIINGNKFNKPQELIL